MPRFFLRRRSQLCLHFPARSFPHLSARLIGDLGGKDRVSTGELQHIRRAATLSVISKSMEADAVANRPFDLEMFGMLCDSLSGAAPSYRRVSVVRVFGQGPA
jgi:hypothetical protein